MMILVKLVIFLFLFKSYILYLWYKNLQPESKTRCSTGTDTTQPSRPEISVLLGAQTPRKDLQGKVTLPGCT